MRHALVVVLLSWASVAAAQPNVTGVSGTVSHGSSITITGTSFGTKATAAPLKYDDFVSTTVGNSPSGWGVQGESGFPKVSTARLRANTPFTKNLEHLWSSGNASSLILTGLSITKMYVDFWRYFDITSATITGLLNIKTIRIHTFDAGSPNHYSQEYGQADGTRPRNMDGVSGWPVSGEDNGYSRCGPGGIGSDLTGVWVHWQWGIDIGSGNGASDGKQLAYWNSVDCYPMGVDGIPATIKMSESGQAAFEEVYIGNYIRGGDYTGSMRAHTDSLYVDTSWARIELCDASTYAARTHCEIQIPSAWSSTSITATVNRGSFTNGNTAYVYVCDDGGTCDSTGTAVTIDAASGGGSTGPVRLRLRG